MLISDGHLQCVALGLKLELLRSPRGMSSGLHRGRQYVRGVKVPRPCDKLISGTASDRPKPSSKLKRWRTMPRHRYGFAQRWIFGLRKTGDAQRCRDGPDGHRFVLLTQVKGHEQMTVVRVQLLKTLEVVASALRGPSFVSGLRWRLSNRLVVTLAVIRPAILTQMTIA